MACWSLAGCQTPVGQLALHDTRGRPVKSTDQIRRLAKDARKKAGLTQHRMADAMGVARATVARWEHGKDIPSGPAMILLELASKREAIAKHLKARANKASKAQA